jgi:hypothetical protein
MGYAVASGQRRAQQKARSNIDERSVEECYPILLKADRLSAWPGVRNAERVSYPPKNLKMLKLFRQSQVGNVQGGVSGTCRNKAGKSKGETDIAGTANVWERTVQAKTWKAIGHILLADGRQRKGRNWQGRPAGKLGHRCAAA